MNIKFALHDDNPAFTPVKAHADDACYDLFARNFSRPDRLEVISPAIQLGPNERCLARTGVYLEMQPGWEALVRPRSGNALKLGFTVLNTPGTIDAGYRNEIGVILVNVSPLAVVINQGMKIAQIAFRTIPEHSLAPISRAEFDADTARSLNGFGSSGV